MDQAGGLMLPRDWLPIFYIKSSLKAAVFTISDGETQTELFFCRKLLFLDILIHFPCQTNLTGMIFDIIIVQD